MPPSNTNKQRLTHPMEETGAVTPDKPVGTVTPGEASYNDPKLPTEPSFGMTEGNRLELESLRQRRDAGEKINGKPIEVKTTSPFTGATLTEADMPPDMPDPVHQVKS